MHDPDEARTILPIGSSEDPRSVHRFSTYGDWSRGRLHPAPLSRDAVDRLAVSREELSRVDQPAERRAAEREPARSRRAAPRRPAPSPRQPLPGQKPDDPTLESAIRYLNRPERTQQEVRAKLQELREYVAGNAALTRELQAGLELFTHLMRESQAGRLPIRYGTPETLELVDEFYRKLKAEPRP
jgi:hypothetical protein